MLIIQPYSLSVLNKLLSFLQRVRDEISIREIIKFISIWSAILNARSVPMTLL